MAMKTLITWIILFCSVSAIQAQTLRSPDGRLNLTVSLTGDGQPTYELTFDSRTVLKKGRLGVELTDEQGLSSGFSVGKIENTEVDETWVPGWGPIVTHGTTEA